MSNCKAMISIIKATCFLYHTCLYSVLLHVRHCYHFIIREFTNKIQECLSFKEYYWDE